VSFKGTVKNGVVVLEPDAKLSEGTVVEVSPSAVLAKDDPFLAAARKVGKPRRHWPKNYARDLDLHLYGVAKKS
jgi:hypothetical protein